MIPQKEGKEKSERSSSFSFSRAIPRVSRLAPSIRRLYTASHRQSSDKADLYTESYVRSSLSVSPLRRIAIIDAAYNPDNRRVWLTTTKRRYRNNDFAFTAKPLRESSLRLDFRCNFIPLRILDTRESFLPCGVETAAPRVEKERSLAFNVDAAGVLKSSEKSEKGCFLDVQPIAL